MKCDPDYAIELRDHYNGVEGAYILTRNTGTKHSFDRDLDDKLIKQLIDHSYDEVLKKFPKNYVQNMTPSPEIFPVPLIHISETNSTNNYLQTLCARQKVGGVDDRSCRLSNIRTRATWEFLGIRTAQEPPF